jgi:hypothetical protein
MGAIGTVASRRSSRHFRADLARHATADELRAAIAAVTHALATVHDRDHVLELVRERAALRRELQAVDEHGG